jgi:hypothetical protein
MILLAILLLAIRADVKASRRIPKDLEAIASAVLKDRGSPGVALHKKASSGGSTARLALSDVLRMRQTWGSLKLEPIS